MTVVHDVDLGGLSLAECRDRIDEGLEGVAPGEQVLVVADRNPELAVRQYQIQHGRPLDWEHEERGPDRWRLRLRDADGPATETDLSTVDVRGVPPWVRQAIVRETFELLPPEDDFLLVSPTDPAAVASRTRGRYRLEYRWKTPGAFRVRVEKVTAGEIDSPTE